MTTVSWWKYHRLNIKKIFVFNYKNNNLNLTLNETGADIPV